MRGEKGKIRKVVVSYALMQLLWNKNYLLKRHLFWNLGSAYYCRVICSTTLVPHSLHRWFRKWHFKSVPFEVYVCYISSISFTLCFIYACLFNEDAYSHFCCVLEVLWFFTILFLLCSHIILWLFYLTFLCCMLCFI